MTARTSSDGATAKGANVCYAVEAVHTRSGNPSHHSAPVCAHAGQTIGTAVRDIRIVRSGACALQLLYRNTADQINLGITGRVTWLAV